MTVSTTSLVVKLFPHEPESVTVRRRVALAFVPVTTTVAVRELAAPEVMVAGPATTVQLVPLSGLVPAWTVPVTVKVVLALSWLHCV